MLTQFLNLLATIISVISLLIVTYGALIAIISFIINELKRITGAYTPTNIRKLRAVFGTYLLLGLEFLIASDILKTVLEPTMNELIILGGIVVVRTILSVFLNKEIKELETENNLAIALCNTLAKFSESIRFAASEFTELDSTGASQMGNK